MWHFVREPEAERVQKYRLLDADKNQVAYGSVIESWIEDDDFREQFIGELLESPFGAYRWETPPVARCNLDRPFEFVLLRCDMLNRDSERAAFAEHFQDDRPIVSFPNLGGDARMIVPCPVTVQSAYAHLAAFGRQAPMAQQHELWIAVGQAMQSHVADRPIWLSTAGMGVAWLHIRLDSRPKYYGYRPYAHWEPN